MPQFRLEFSKAPLWMKILIPVAVVLILGIAFFIFLPIILAVLFISAGVGVIMHWRARKSIQKMRGDLRKQSGLDLEVEDVDFEDVTDET